MNDFEFLNLPDDEGYTNLRYRQENRMFWILVLALAAALPLTIILDDIQATIIVGTVISIGFALYSSLIGNAEWNEKVRIAIYTKNKKARRRWVVITLSITMLLSLIWLLDLFLTEKSLTPALIMIFFTSLTLISGLISISIKRKEAQKEN